MHAILVCLFFGHFVDIKGILFNIVSNAGQRWRHAWRVSSALFNHAIR